MGLGLFVYDVLYLSLATALYGGAAWAAGHTFAWLSRFVPWPWALFPSVLTGLVALVCEVGLLTALLPPLVPGRYRMLRSQQFHVWVLRSMLRRLLYVPGLHWFLFTSNVLRFLTLRALGAKVAFSASMSADVDVLDPCLLVVGPGGMVGGKCRLVGHAFYGDKLLLGEVRLEASASLGGEVTVSPGVTVGARASVMPRALIGPHVTIGADARIGHEATLDAFTRVGARADVALRAYLPPRTKVPEGGRYPVENSAQEREDASNASSTSTKAAPAV